MPRHGLLFLAILASQSQADSIAPYQQLGWVTREHLPQEHQARLPSFCSGDYLPTKISVVQDDALHMQSDHMDFYEKPDKNKAGASFQGNVLLQKMQQQIEADSATYNQDSADARFKGNIRYRNNSIAMAAETLEFNNHTGQAILDNAHYVIAPLHMRGTADNISLIDNNAILLNASYTFCEPGHNDWDLKAGEIGLYQDQGYGEAYHARLRIKNVPILYLPYFRFPLSEQRLTGFLNPEISLSISSKKGSPFEDVEVQLRELATPLYINIAPNYDDTFTPRYLEDHGFLSENQFRYLNFLGEGEINLAYLDNDNGHQLDSNDIEYRDSTRWSQSLKHSGKINPQWSNRIDYNKVSDVHYTDDFRPSGIINRNSHLKQNAELEYNNRSWKLLLRAESYQTIDENLLLPPSADADKPYHRLPQVTLTQLNNVQVNQFNYQFTADATRFTRNNSLLRGVNKIDGERFHSEIALSYPLEQSYGFLKSSLNVQHTQYSFNSLDPDAISEGYQDEVSRDIYIASLDAGLFFERNFLVGQQTFIQTLEPRMMLAHIPYKNQSHIPLFDTAQTSFSYGQLFSANRFTGIDRVGDTQQVSLGLTSRLLNDSGTEFLRASIGQIQYLQDRKVELQPGPNSSLNGSIAKSDLLSSSAIAAEVQWLLTESWRSRLDIQYNPHAEKEAEPIEKASIQLNFQGQSGGLFDMNLSHVEASKQKQIGLGFFIPFTDSFAMYVQKKHDIWPYAEAAKDLKEDDNLLNIEGLIGIEYQNCCIRAQVTYEEHTRSDNTKDYQYMLQVHFKGLGILGSDTESILSERIFAYDQREIHDY